MMIMRTAHTVCLAASLALLAACGSGSPAPANAPAPTSSSSNGPITSAIDHALDRASAKIASQNISISNGRDDVPDAAITPQGDFLIDGKPVSVSPAQRAELLAYRRQIVQIAQQGIVIGKQGAALGLDAAGEAIASVLSGGSEDAIEQHVKARAGKIQQAASKLCDRLPALMASQQKLAADIPAFKPYADMTQDDIDDCRSDARRDGH